MDKAAVMTSMLSINSSHVLVFAPPTASVEKPRCYDYKGLGRGNDPGYVMLYGVLEALIVN